MTNAIQNSTDKPFFVVPTNIQICPIMQKLGFAENLSQCDCPSFREKMESDGKECCYEKDGRLFCARGQLSEEEAKQFPINSRL
jgi:hypothetical protein